MENELLENVGIKMYEELEFMLNKLHMPSSMFHRKTSKQHYVPRCYLHLWKDATDTLYQLVNGKIVTARGELKVVAQTKDFYRVRSLNEIEYQLLESTIHAYQYATKVIREFIAFYLKIYDLAGKTHESFSTSQKLSKITDVLVNDLVETLYAEIEGKAAAILRDMANGNMDWWNDSNKRTDFYIYWGTQYTRTPTILERAQRFPLPSGVSDAVYPVTMMHLAMMIVDNMIVNAEKYHVELIKNNSSLQFITGDQPIIDLRKNNDQALDMYFPVSPKYALRIKNKNSDAPINSEVTEAHVEEYNQAIKKNCRFLYAADKKVLESYI